MCVGSTQLRERSSLRRRGFAAASRGTTLAVVVGLLSLISAADDITVGNLSTLSGRTIFLPEESVTLRWNVSHRGTTEDFVALVHNGDFRIHACGPFLRVARLNETDDSQIEGVLEIELPSEPGVYNIYMFTEVSGTANSESHTELAGCALQNSFNVTSQFDVSVHEREGVAAAFDGIDDALLMTTVNGTTRDCPSPEGFTIEVWIRCQGDCTDRTVLDMPSCNLHIRIGEPLNYVAKDNSITYASLSNTKSIVFEMRTESGATVVAYSRGIVSDGRWHHIAAVVELDRTVIYVDGVPGKFESLAHSYSPMSTGANFSNNSPFLVLGGRLEDPRISLDPTSCFPGFMSEFRIWTSGLSMPDIRGRMRTREVARDGGPILVLALSSNVNDEDVDGLTYVNGATQIISTTPFQETDRDEGLPVTCDTVATEGALMGAPGHRDMHSGYTRVRCPRWTAVGSPWSRWCGMPSLAHHKIYGENEEGYADISHICRAAWHAEVFMRDTLETAQVIFDLNWRAYLDTYATTESSVEPRIFSQPIASESIVHRSFRMRNVIVGPATGGIELHENGDAVAVDIGVGHQPLCRGIRSLINGLCYFLIPYKLLWDDAKEACSDWGGRIAQTRTDYDRDFIEEIISEYEAAHPLEDTLHPMWISRDPHDEEGLFIDIFERTSDPIEWELCVYAQECRFTVTCERVLRIDLQFLTSIGSQVDASSLTIGDPDLPPNPLLMTFTALDWSTVGNSLELTAIDDNMVEGPRTGGFIIVRGLPGDPTFVSNDLFLPLLILSDDDTAELRTRWENMNASVSQADAENFAIRSSCIDSCPVPKAFEWGASGSASVQLVKQSRQECEGILDRGDHSGSCYISFFDRCEDRSTASDICESIGASLVSVNSLNESSMLSLLLELAAPGQAVWTGSVRSSEILRGSNATMWDFVQDDASPASYLRSLSTTVHNASDRLYLDSANNVNGFIVVTPSNDTVFTWNESLAVDIAAAASADDQSNAALSYSSNCFSFVCERQSVTTLRFFDRTTLLTWPQIDVPEDLKIRSYEWQSWHSFPIKAVDDTIVEIEMQTGLPLECKVVDATDGSVFGGDDSISAPLLPSVGSDASRTLQGVTSTIRVIVVDDDNKADVQYRSIPSDLPPIWDGTFVGVEGDGLRNFTMTLENQPAADVYLDIVIDPPTDACEVYPTHLMFQKDLWPQTHVISVNVPPSHEINDVDIVTSITFVARSEDPFFNESLKMLQMREDFRHRIGTQWSGLHSAELDLKCMGTPMLTSTSSNDVPPSEKDQALWFNEGKGLAITNRMDFSNGGTVDFTIRTQPLTPNATSHVVLEALIEGWEYAGCWTRQEIDTIDPWTGRPSNVSWYVDVLSESIPAPVHEPDAIKCAERCPKQGFFGLSNVGHGSTVQRCWCGDELDREAQNIDESYCSTPCTDLSTGDACSSDARVVAIYARETSDQWEYVGCYRRSHSMRNRDVSGKVFQANDLFERPLEIHTLMSPSLRLCATACGRSLFSLSPNERGEIECFCSESLNSIEETLALEDDYNCATPCSDNDAFACGTYQPPHEGASILHTGTQHVAVYRRIGALNVIRDSLSRLEVSEGSTDTDWVNAEIKLTDGDYREIGWLSFPADDPVQVDFHLDDTHCISRATISWYVPSVEGQGPFIPRSMTLLADGDSLFSGTFSSIGDGDPVERSRVVDVWDRVLSINDDIRFERTSTNVVSLRMAGLVRNAFRINEFNVFGHYGPCHDTLYQKSPIHVIDLYGSGAPGSTTVNDCSSIGFMKYSIDIPEVIQKPAVSLQWRVSEMPSFSWALDSILIRAVRDIELHIVEYRIICDENIDGTNGTIVTEGGSEREYLLRIVATIPQSPIVVHIEPQTRWDDRPQLRVWPNVVTFVAKNYTESVKIHVEAIDDDLYEYGDHWAMIHHFVDSHPRYAYERMFRSVNVTIEDNDTPGVLISKSSLRISETDGGYYGGVHLPEGMPIESSTETYAVTLSSEPFSPVTIDFLFDGSNLVLSSTSIVISPIEWNVPQFVHVSAVSDHIDEGVDHTYDSTIRHEIFAGGIERAYSSVEDLSFFNGTLPIDVRVVIVDDDEAGVIASKRTVRFIDANVVDTYNITLSSRPTHPVNISFHVDNWMGDFNVFPSHASITPELWRGNIVVTVTRYPIDPEQVIGVLMYTTGEETNLFESSGHSGNRERRSLKVVSLGYEVESTDPKYRGITVSVAKTNGYQPDDVAILKPFPRIVAEGEGKSLQTTMAFYSIVLAQAPVVVVDVQCDCGPETRIASVSSNHSTTGDSVEWETSLRIQFSPDDWRQERLIAIRAFDDKVWEMEHFEIVTHSTNWNSQWHGAVPLDIPIVDYAILDRDAILFEFGPFDGPVAHIDDLLSLPFVHTNLSFIPPLHADSGVSGVHSVINSSNPSGENISISQDPIGPIDSGIANRVGARSEFLQKRGCEVVIAEGSSNLMYAVVLSHRPLFDVIITISSTCENQLVFFRYNQTVDVEQSWIPHPDVGRSYDLVFTPSDWNIPRLVPVQSVQDHEHSPTLYCVIQHVASSEDPHFVSTVGDFSDNSLVPTEEVCSSRVGRRVDDSIGIREEPTGAIFFAPSIGRHAFGGTIGVKLIDDDPWWVRQNLWRMIAITLSVCSLLTIACACVNSILASTTARPTGDALAYLWTIQFLSISGEIPLFTEQTEILSTFTGCFDWSIVRVGRVVATPDQQDRWHAFVAGYVNANVGVELAEPLLLTVVVVVVAALARTIVSLYVRHTLDRADRVVATYPPSTFPLAKAVGLNRPKDWKDPADRTREFAGKKKKQDAILERCKRQRVACEPFLVTRRRNILEDVGLKMIFPKWELTALLFCCPGLCLGAGTIAFRGSIGGANVFAQALIFFVVIIMPVLLFLFLLLFLYASPRANFRRGHRKRWDDLEGCLGFTQSYGLIFDRLRDDRGSAFFHVYMWTKLFVFATFVGIMRSQTSISDAESNEAPLHTTIGDISEKGCIAFCAVELLQLFYVMTVRPYIAYVNNIQCAFGSLYRFGTLSLVVAMKEGTSPLTVEQVLLFWTTFMVIFFCARETARMSLDLWSEQSQWRYEYSKLTEYDTSMSGTQTDLTMWEQKAKHGYFEEDQITKRLEALVKAEEEKVARAREAEEQARNEKLAIAMSKRTSRDTPSPDKATVDDIPDDDVDDKDATATREIEEGTSVEIGDSAKMNEASDDIQAVSIEEA